MESPRIAIHVNDLGKRFNREWIFRRFQFQFNPGKTYAITGPNGSGKSTLMQVLWGQSPQSKGTLEYRHEDKIMAVEEIYKHIAIATPYMDLIDEFTLEEQINFHFKLKSIRSGISTVELMDRMYLVHSRNKQIGNFSSGMRQRLKLGLAFYTSSSILFLDEPGTNLDAEAFRWYLKQLNELPPSMLVFIASNNPEEYGSAAETIHIMNYK